MINASSLNNTFVIFVYILLFISACTEVSKVERQHDLNKQTVQNVPGLIAFWDFQHSKDNTWISHYDPQTTDRPFPLYLKQIGDQKNYPPPEWPYSDSNSELLFDHSGPFGKAIRFNKGYVYGAVPRQTFDKTLLDLHGRRPFTMIVWAKFIGERHMAAGIWDEGGWHKYAGRRQAALFGGLFQQKGVIAHISATGAASYPQSNVKGAQYARVRAIDGQAFENDQWISMAMTYDPEKKEVKAYLNGKMTPLKLTDPVAQDVYHYQEEQIANPLQFEGPVFSPRSFTLKYNGYNLIEDGVSEHRLQVDLENLKLSYRQDGSKAGNLGDTYRILFDLKRAGKSILDTPLIMEAKNDQTAKLPPGLNVHDGDEVLTSLEVLENGKWRQIGTQLQSNITQGAPFTFGRALGLASEEIDHGSQLYLDGVAVFNRALKEEELRKLSF